MLKFFIKKCFQQKIHFFYLLNLFKITKFLKKKFLAKLYKNFGILHTNDDLFVNFLNKNYLELELQANNILHK